MKDLRLSHLQSQPTVTESSECVLDAVASSIFAVSYQQNPSDLEMEATGRHNKIDNAVIQNVNHGILTIVAYIVSYISSRLYVLTYIL